MATTKPPTAGPAITLGQQQYNTGQGLLEQPIAGNGVGQFQNSNVLGNSWSNRAPRLQTTRPASPWLRQQGRGILNQTNQMLGDNLLGIQGNAVSTGTMGGSRQGIAQGTALGQASNYMSANLADMYGSAYESDANRNMQRYGIDQNSYLQQRGQDVTTRGQDQDFYGQQRQQDLAQANLGSSLINQGFDTQWAPMQNASQVYARFGNNGTTTTTTQSGGGWRGALADGGSTYQAGRAAGWW